MVTQTQKGRAGGALIVIAILLVSMSPLILNPTDTSLSSLDPSNVYADLSVVKQGGEVTIYLSDLILSDSVDVYFFVFDFHDGTGIYYIDHLNEPDRSLSHVFAKVGRFDVSVLALRGNISRVFTVPITVIPDDLDIHITANISNAVEDQPIMFEVDKSMNLYATSVEYVWEFGDGARLRTTDEYAIHSYKNTGNYTVKLRGYTNESMVYTDFYHITIRNEIPNVNIQASSITSEGTRLKFTAVVAESASDLSSLSYIWDFGDNTYASGLSVVHQFFNNGIFRVVLHAIDDDGAIGTSSLDVNVINLIPSVSLHSDKLAYYEGETAITTASIIDSINDIPYLNFDWNVNATGQQASIPMLDDGLYRFSVNVTDDNGAEGFAETDLINIVNLSPVISLINAYSDYNVTFKIYGTVGTKVNMTFFTNDIQEFNTSLTSYSLNSYEANTSSYYNFSQNLQEYSDVLYYLDNQSSTYDNYVITTFSFTQADNFTIINHCTSDQACSAITWREPISPLDRGFPVTMELEYFDPGNDDLTIGVDFGSQTFTSFQPKQETSNFGTTTITGQLPYGQHPSNVKYWGLDDDNARTDYSLPLLDYSTVERPPGYLNSTFWARWGHTITHYAPGAFISLGGGGYNTTTWDDEFYEGAPQVFNVDPMYADPVVLEYQWHFGDGTPIVKEKSPTHIFNFSGRYLVWVLISDGSYESVSYQWMDVINQVQSFEPMIVGNLLEGENIDFSIAGMVDEIMFTSQYQFFWDFGDGRREYGTDVSHTYQDAGNFTLSITMLDEHLNMDVFTFTLPISATNPFVVIPMDESQKLVENTNLMLNPMVRDSAYDSLDLAYQWDINGSIYTSSSLNLQLPAGVYLGNFTATDNDELSYTHQLNYTILPSPVEITMYNFEMYGRTINNTIEVHGTISPSIFEYMTISQDSSLRYTLFSKTGEILDQGSGSIGNDLKFIVTIDLDGIYNNESINALSINANDIRDLLANTPEVVSGEYNIRIEVITESQPKSEITRKLKLIADQDGDMLTDELEVLLRNMLDDVLLDPLVADTNNNGIVDPVEFLLADDPDNDGLPSILEYEWNTDPNNPDTDGDGLEDGYGPQGLGEMTYGTDPNNPDTDGDGINDFVEVVGWEIAVYYKGDRLVIQQVTSNPLSNDSDSDGMSDYFEMNLLTDPKSEDTDGDKLTDGEEQDRGTIPYRYDSDNDGLSDYEEVNTLFTSEWEDIDQEIIYQSFYTDPLSNDTDNDGISDWYEVRVYGSVATNADTDQDYINDNYELLNGTSMIDSDTDNDLLLDGAEIFGFVIPVVTITMGSYDENGNVLVQPTKQNSTIIVKTNPLLADTDADGLTDYEELMDNSTRISNPTLADSDGDGMLDSIDPYPIIPDFAPPSLVLNVNGEMGISLYYKVGDNSLVGNLKQTLSASLTAIWGIMKGAGSLVSDIIKSIFYWKCITRVFGRCVLKIPWVRSTSEITRNVKAAITKFVSATESRLRQMFSAYSSLTNSISKTFGFSSFRVSIQKSNGVPVGMSLSGLFKLFSTSSTKIVKNLVDPTVNVKFTVEDDNIIDRIVIYQNSRLVETINVNAKSYNFNRDYSILADTGGSTSTSFKFMIYDKAGNVKVIERSDSVTNFIDKIVNQVVKSLKSVIDTLVNWAKDIAETVIDAIVEVANVVIDAAIAIYESIKDFALNVIPSLFKAFIIDTVGKYLKQKYDDSQTAIALLSSTYQSLRPDVVTAIDDTISSLGIIDGINASVYEIQNLFDNYLPPLDPEEIKKELLGGSDFLKLGFLSGTIFEYVISFLKDGFMGLLKDVLSSLVDKLVESVLTQYLQPLLDLYDQLIEVFSLMNISMGNLDNTALSNGQFSIGAIDGIVTQVLSFANLLRNPAEAITPILNSINGDNIMNIIDVLFIDNPNLLISMFDLIQAILTPIVMLGLVTYDIVTWTGELFSKPMILNNMNDLQVNLLGIPYDINKMSINSATLDDARGWGRALSIIKLVWKAFEIGLDFGLSILVGEDRNDDGKLIHITVKTDFSVRFFMFATNLVLDTVIDGLYNKTIGGEGKFREKRTTHIIAGIGIILKGTFLEIVEETCYSSGGGPQSCSSGFFTPTNYDYFANIIDFIDTIAVMVFNIVDFEIDSEKGGSDIAVFVMKLIVSVLDIVFIPANVISSFGMKISHPLAKAIYYGIYLAKGVVDWIAELIDILNNW